MSKIGLKGPWPTMAPLMAGAIIILCSCSDNNRIPEPDRPHLLLVTLDTVRADHLSCYGYYRPTTPFLEKFVKRSVMFRRTETASTITLASHASLMSSLYPRSHGAEDNGWRVKSSAPLLAEILSGHGYQTAAIIGAFPLHGYTRINRGFDLYDDDYSPKKSTNINKKDGLVRWRRPGRDVIETGMESLEKFDHTRPWFLWLHLWDAHPPYFCRREFTLFFNNDPTLEARAGKLNTLKKFERRVNRYDSAIRQLDHDLEWLLQWMEKKGYLEHTMVVIWSDHGEELGEHNHRGHGFLVYEAESWVPLIVRFPRDQYGGRVVGDLVSTLDLAPTLYDFLGIKGPKKMKGVSLMPAVTWQGAPPGKTAFIRRRWQPAHKTEEGVYFEQNDTLGVVSGKHKYIWNSAKPSELYNLETDPHELNNIIDREPELVSSLQQVADTHQHEVGPVPRDKPPIPKIVEQGLKALGYVD